MSLYALMPRFKALFTGFDSAYGTGEGRWVKSRPGPGEYLAHLEGRGPGLGIGPLMRDGTVRFAAIDLDEPDFDAAREFQTWIPGRSFIERSRSGNAHVWVFFSEPVEAWIATGILRESTVAEGKPHVEIFPKQTSFSNVSLGNYINLPYYGGERPILWTNEGGTLGDYTLEGFLDDAEAHLNDPQTWRTRARWLMLEDPALKRKDASETEFGQQRSLHCCADKIIGEALDGTNPIAQGHRSVVYFNLAKQLANWSGISEDDALQLLIDVRDASDELLQQPRKPDSELRRYLRNAYEKQYTSTGCDDPVFGPYAHPDCPIAHPRR